MKSILTVFAVCLITPLTSQLTNSGWVGTITGSGYEIIADIKTDQQRNIYTIGSFSGTADFDGSAMTNNKTSKGESDIFVTKHQPNGQLIWVATFGSTQNDIGFSLDIQDSGEVYAVGTFTGQADFDPGVQEVSLTAAGQQDFFIVKLTSSGALIWAKRIGGTNVDEANDVAIDHNNNIYIVGRFVGTVDFNPGVATYNLQAGSTPDAFVLKLNNDGEFLWAYDFGSGSNEEAEAVVVDGQNNVIVAGNFAGTTDFDPGPSQQSVYGDGLADPFYLKLTPDGAFVWVTTFTSTGFVYAGDIDVDKDDNIVTHGFFTNHIKSDPDNAGSIILSKGAEDSYTGKIKSNGELAWLNTLGGTSLEFGYGVAVDQIGDVYVTGFYYDSPDFDPGAGEFFLPSAGIEDTYIVKYNSQGQFVWAKRTGGSSSDAGYGIDISASSDILIAGNYWGNSDLDPEPEGTLNIQSKGSSDVFILQIEQMITSTADDLALTADWKLSPNPSSGSLTISGVDRFPVSITVMDMKGSNLNASYLLQSPGQMIDLNHLLSGIYYINIQSADASAIRKWIKI